VLLEPLRWKRPRKIFVCAHGDLFHEKVPDEWIDRCFAVMALTPQHVFQVLTKRPERMREYLNRYGPDGGGSQMRSPCRTIHVEKLAPRPAELAGLQLAAPQRLARRQRRGSAARRRAHSRSCSTRPPPCAGSAASRCSGRAYSPAHAAGIGGITFAEGSEPQGNIAWPDGTVGYGCAEDHGGAGQQLTLWHHKRNAGRLLDGVQHDGYPA
jgi:hypothetical protein